MVILGNNKDKFGFYQVGEYKTYSKVDAIELHRRTGIHPHWNFNEDIFSNYDWTKEPPESLDDLYRRRAQQIRETYDHVVLVCSGGADSNNILDTFVNNNIKFEEVLTYHYAAADNNPQSCFQAELTNVLYPKLKKLKDQDVGFYHRDFDLSFIAQQILTSSEFRLNRGYLSGHWFSTAHVSKSYIRESIPDYVKLAELGKKIVFVWGSEKPRLFKENDRYCIRFLDVIDNAVNPRMQMLNRTYEYDELFYWAPESVDIICKQGHVLKKFFDRYDLFNQDLYYSDQKIQLPDVAEIFNNKNTNDGLSHRDLINTLIYTTWDTKTFSVGKGFSPIISINDCLWNGDTLFRQHMDLLIQHVATLPKYWWSDEQDPTKGIKLCISPAYYLH